MFVAYMISIARQCISAKRHFILLIAIFLYLHTSYVLANVKSLSVSPLQVHYQRYVCSNV